jgi:hypothetical protein
MKPVSNWTAHVTIIAEVIVALGAIVESVKAVITQ